MEEEKKELEKIEFSKSSWRSDFAREMDIWKAIAMQINSYKGDKQKYWCRVMDLFNEKYRPNEKQG